MTRRFALAAALAAGCAARRPEPVGRVVWVDPPPNAPAPDANAPDASAPAAPANPPRPMVAALPTLALDNLRFRDTHECARGECVHARSPLAPAEVATDDGATALPPASAWVQVIRPGATVRVPADPAIDLLGVTLVGAVSLDQAPSPRSAAPTAPAWTAFRYGGAGAVLRASGTTPAAVLLVTATGPATPSAEADAGARGPYRAVTRDLSATETLTWAGGAMHARIAFDATTSPRASLEVLFASDDAPVAEHAHPGAWETLVALSAAGHLHLPAQRVGERDLPARDRTVTDGTIVYVPADVRHAWVPDGTHPLVAIQLYSPPGPEQRFRTLAAPPSPAPPAPAP
ncbi:MAG: cupin domain-containing protein [Polyangiales bacterium]